MSAVNNLNLEGMINAYRKDGAKSIYQTYNGGHVIGRLNNEYRLERYEFTPSEPVVTINFDFSSVYSSSIGIYRNFTHYQGTDLRSGGVGVYISTKDDMSDWEDFFPTSTHSQRGAWLKFESNFTKLKGTLTLNEPLESNKTYYIFFYSQNSVDNGWGALYWSNGGGPTNNSTYISYTAPSIPADFSFIGLGSNGKVLNSGFGLSWSAAADGVNNPVEKYELKFSWSSDIKSIDPVTSYTFNNEEGSYQEGEKISVQIRAVGNQTNTSVKYSEWSMIECLVNNRPSQPNITTEGAAGIFGEGGKVILKIDYETVDKDGDSVECYYQSKQTSQTEWSEEKLINNTTFSIDLTEQTEFKFYCTDGIERSQEKLFTIEAYDLAIDQEVLLSCSNSSQESITKIRLDFAQEEEIREFVPFISLMLYFDDDNTPSWTQIIPTSASFVLDVFEKKIKYKPEAEKYKIVACPLDSSNKSFSKNDGNTYVINIINEIPLFNVPQKETIMVYDNWEKGENIHNSSDYPCFFQKVKIILPPFDSQIFSYDNYLQFGTEKYKLSTNHAIENAKEDEQWEFRTSLPVTKSSKNEELKILLSRGSDTIYEIDLGEYNQIPEFSFDGFEAVWSNIVPIYDQENLVFSHGFSDEKKKIYGMKGSKEDINFQIEYGSIKSEISVDSNFVEATSTQSYTCLINKEVIDNLKIEADEYFGNKTFICTLSLKNKYGYESKHIFNIISNFNKVSELTLRAIKMKTDSSEGYIEIGQDFKFLEGMQLQVDYLTKWWSFDEDISLQITAKHTNNEDVFLKNIVLYRQPITVTNSYGGTDNSKTAEFKIPSILDEGKWTLYLEVLSKNKLGNSITSNPYQVIPVSFPRLKLNKIEYSNVAENDNQYALIYDYNSNHLGSIYLNWEENSENSIRVSESNVVSFNVSEDPLSSKDSIVMWIEAKEEISNSGYTLTKIWSSNTLVVYNLVPTVAYRKNRLIINSKEGEDDSVLYISRASNAHMIRLKIQDETGNSQEDITIDLYTGSINNVLIDGGSW